MSTGFLRTKKNGAETCTLEPLQYPELEYTVYEPGSKLVVLGMAIPPLIGNPYSGYINPYYWVEFPIPYYMAIMVVDRPY